MRVQLVHQAAPRVARTAVEGEGHLVARLGQAGDDARLDRVDAGERGALLGDVAGAVGGPDPQPVGAGPERLTVHLGDGPRDGDRAVRSGGLAVLAHRLVQHVDDGPVDGDAVLGGSREGELRRAGPVGTLGRYRGGGHLRRRRVDADLDADGGARRRCPAAAPRPCACRRRCGPPARARAPACPAATPRRRYGSSPPPACRRRRGSAASPVRCARRFSAPTMRSEPSALEAVEPEAEPPAEPDHGRWTPDQGRTTARRTAAAMMTTATTKQDDPPPARAPAALLAP